MDPITIAILGSSMMGGAASAYGAYNQDKQSANQLAYQKKRDALADKRQDAQDIIAARERRSQLILQMLERSRQQREQAASQWHPSMSQSRETQ